LRDGSDIHVSFTSYAAAKRKPDGLLKKASRVLRRFFLSPLLIQWGLGRFAGYLATTSASFHSIRELGIESNCDGKL
jgi:hypothetical protein